MKIINIHRNYQVSIRSISYQLNEEYMNRVGRKRVFNIKLKEYRDELDRFLNEEYKRFFNSLSSEKKLLCNNYNRVLKNLKLRCPDKASEYISNRPYISFHQEQYYKNIYEKYFNHDKNDFKIKSIDSNNRIYSILTNTPKKFKNYLNINYSIDINNSHPLLFNYFILKDYNYINKDIINYILDTYQYDSEEESINLINSNIRNRKNANFKKTPKDIIRYIYSTSKGVFWDDFVELFKSEGLERKDVKVTLFKEVFYSKSKTTLHKQFAKAFKRVYPTVYKLINRHKPNEDRTKLSHDMMALESEIFHKILNNLYKKRGCDALSIHDAIIILDTGKTNQYTPEQIEKVMRKVYAEYNLSPSFSIEFYALPECSLCSEDKEALRAQLNDFKNSLEVSEENNDKELLWKLQEGEHDISIMSEKIVVEDF